MKVGEWARRKEVKNGHFVGFRKVVATQRRKNGQWFQFKKDVGRIVHGQECWRPVWKYHVAHKRTAAVILSQILDFLGMGQSKFWTKFMGV